jgi:predicted PurR-regulated permease PerM
MDVSHQVESDERVINLSLKIALRLTLAGILTIFCFRIILPFLIPLVWGTIIAVALKGVFGKMVGWLGGRRGIAGVLFSQAGVLLVLGPSYILGNSLVQSIQALRNQVDAGTVQIPPPPASVGNIPLVGDRIVEGWTLASTNLEQAMVKFEPQIQAFGRWTFGFLASIGGTILTTVLSFVIAGLLLTYAEPATKSILP